MNVSRIARWTLWVLVYAFLISYLDPESIPKNVPVTGGDLASHYAGLEYIVGQLLPQGKILGWNPGNYAGYPQFQMYFPAPFLFMAALSLVVPLAVAFKLVCLAGVIGLPLTAAGLIRFMGFERPAPEIGAVFTLPFLFSQANSAWGGNLLSVMSGEFSYSISLTLSLLYLGRVYRDIDQSRGIVGNAVLLALVGLFHGYPLLFCILGTGFFLLTVKGWTDRLAYILEVNLLAFCLMGFWIVPLLLFSPYTTPLNFVWIINDWREVFPLILLPFAASGVLGMVLVLPYAHKESRNRRRYQFFLYLFIVSVVFYFIAFKIGVVDVRFVPFGQLFLVLAGAVFISLGVKRLKARSLAALALALSVVVWTAGWEKVVDQWVEWNFSGWKNKPLWSAFHQTTEYLSGDFSNPRVVYEHCGVCNAAGTVRAFECLPMFSRRATLEGAYIQACLTSPSVFYIQSLISRDISSPLTQYNYGRFDLQRAAPLLDLFNVGQYITVTEESKAAAVGTPGYRLEKSFAPFAVFRVESCGGRYVDQPAYRPVLALSHNPKRDSFAWLRWANPEVPLVLKRDESRIDGSSFAAVLKPEEIDREALSRLPEIPLPPGRPKRETVLPEEIIIEGATPGRPLWVKVTYHPNWKVEGAQGPWRTAPSFMMVLPTHERVRLFWGKSFPDYFGIFLTILGVLYVAWRFLARVKKPPLFQAPLVRITAPLTRLTSPRAKGLLTGAIVLLASAALYLILAVGYKDPVVYYHRGLDYFEVEDYPRAIKVFSEAMDRFPLSPVVDRTLHHLALSYYNQGQYERAGAIWGRFQIDYPESRLLPEAIYHMGLCEQKSNRLEAAYQIWSDLSDFFPGSPWTDLALKHIGEAKSRGPNSEASSP